MTTASRDANGAAARCRVLMLAFEFAPLATGGVHRPLGFARALSGHGCDVEVVTVRAADYGAWTDAAIDETTDGRLPDDVRIHRIPSGFPTWYWRLIRHRVGLRAAQYLHWGDPVSWFWRGPLFERLDQIIAVRRPDVLLATAPPFGVAVLARLAARRYALPFVVDFRDAWVRWCVAPYPTVLHYLYARLEEGRVLRDSNVTVATSHVTRDDWARDHPKVESTRLVTVYNGYDRPLRHAASPGGAKREEEWTPASARRREILYVGSFYYTPEARAATFRPLWRRRPQHWLHYRLRREDWLYRSPYFFLRGLRRLNERDPDSARRLRVSFVGRVATWLPAMLEATGTTHLVHLAGVRPHTEVLALETAAAAVLLTSAKVEGGRDYSIAGKTYEYFAARKPIVALLTDGAMQDLVRQSGLGLFADPDDVDAVADVLKAVAVASDPAGLVTPNETFLDRFERPRLAGELATHLRRAAGEGYRG